MYASIAVEERVLRNENARVVFCHDAGDLVEQAAELFVTRVQSAVASRGRCAVALSGCVTSMLMNARLASDAFSRRIPWPKVHVFWTDEICVAVNGRKTRYQDTHDALLSRVPIPKRNIYPLPVGQADCERAAAEYEQTLRAFFGLRAEELPRFDLVCLELAPDGHAASLFPGSSAVEETTRLVTATYVRQLGELRTTLTAPAINNAASVMFLVAGENRAAVLHEVLSGDYQPERLPLQLIRPESGELFYFVDQLAAGSLQPQRMRV
jgi:6-phosphogluconolactonase